MAGNVRKLGEMDEQKIQKGLHRSWTFVTKIVFLEDQNISFCLKSVPFSVIWSSCCKLNYGINVEETITLVVLIYRSDGITAEGKE